ncbi:MAG TPA: hypothetical protein VNS09_07725 [Solirubrobacter sp.]|nr:hypothetical protein [Solirubrobacter sp.]
MTPRIELVTPRLLPVHLERTPTPSFSAQLEHLHAKLGPLVEWLDPAPISDAVPAGVSAVVVPDLNGLAYRMLDAFAAIEVPILIITSEFGTVSMWDWEIRDHLRRRGVATVAPTSLLEAHDICRALGVKASLRRSRLLTYQDNPGEGMQPEIFKRFFWWESEAVARMTDAFGVTIDQRSFRALGERARAVPDERVAAVGNVFAGRVREEGLTDTAKAAALRMYVALGDELDETDGVIAAGINCLNESAFSDTTPCLAWNLLFEERGLMWGCEADLLSMLTEFIVHKSLDVPVMMTNLYPFLIGDAALKHERIPYFPEVDEPEHHVLAGHCGYFGVVPQSFATSWSVRPRVLPIVDEHAHALDARLPEGPTTIVKLASTMDTLVVSPANLERYIRYEDSDVLNGAILRVDDGPRFVEHLPSHHVILATGGLMRRLEVIAQVMGLSLDRI